MNLSALHCRITKTIFYPLLVTSFTNEQCTHLEKLLYQKNLPRCGISSKFPLAIRYSPKCFYGLDIANFYISQGTFHVQELIKSFDQDNITSQQFQLSLELAQLTIGSPTWLFDQDSYKYSHLLDNVWMGSTWKFLHEYKFKIHAPHLDLQPPRLNDKFIMPTFAAMSISPKNLSRLNK